MKILKTNWINFVGILFSVFLYSFVVNLFDKNVAGNVGQALLAASILVGFYGFAYCILLLLVLVVLDLLLIVNRPASLANKIIIEWLIVSSPLAYWAIKFKTEIFIVGIISLFIAQLIRKRQIARLFQTAN